MLLSYVATEKKAKCSSLGHKNKEVNSNLPTITVNLSLYRGSFMNLERIIIFNIHFHDTLSTKAFDLSYNQQHSLFQPYISMSIPDNLK